MAEDTDSPLGELHHGTAAKVVRAAESVYALAELEFEEREGKGRRFVLDAVAERAAELVAELSDEQARAEIAGITDGVGDTALEVLQALERRGEPAEKPEGVGTPEPASAPASAPEPASAPVEPPTRAAGPSKAPEPAEPSEPKPPRAGRPSRSPGRALIGPVVRVRAGEGTDLVPAAELWAKRSNRKGPR